MARKISVATREELSYRSANGIEQVRERRSVASSTNLSRLLGYHRKHGIRVLKAGPRAATPETRRGHLRLYDDAVRQAVVVLWEAADRVCGKRLRPLLPILVPALERHGHLRLDEMVRTRVLAASAATIDRLLKPTRASVDRERLDLGQFPAYAAAFRCARSPIGRTRSRVKTNKTYLLHDRLLSLVTLRYAFSDRAA